MKWEDDDGRLVLVEELMPAMKNAVDVITHHAEKERHTQPAGDFADGFIQGIRQAYETLELMVDQLAVDEVQE